MSRNKDAAFMARAKVVATLATCLRKKVGCVVVTSEGHDRVTGYNGSLPGEAHCLDVGCLMRDGHCIRCVHAEANAIGQAARDGVSLKGGTIYVTASPCLTCFQLLLTAGIKRIVYGEFYRDNQIFTVAESQGIELVDGTTLPALGITV